MDTKADSQGYFAVSHSKLGLMSLCTLGLYELYWFYRNWQCVKSHTGADIMPFWRGFFAPIWSFVLFKYLSDELQARGQPPLRWLFWGLLYGLINILAQLGEPYLFLTVLSFTALLSANAALQRLNQLVAPDRPLNNKIEGWNWLAVIVGGLFYILLLIGLLGPGEMAPGPRI